jgi:hypothetical protein
MDFTHRAKKSETYILWGSLVFWTSSTIAFFAFAPRANPDAPISKLSVQLLASPFFLFWILLSIAGIIHANRYYLRVTDCIVEKKGIFRHRAIELNDVLEANWWRFGGMRGRLVLRTPTAKVAVGLSDYSREETQKLVRFFRARFPTSIQTGWDKYWNQHWALFDEREKLSPGEIAAAQRASRRLFFWCSAVSWIAFAAGGFFAWRYTGETKWLWQPLGAMAVLAFAVYYFPKHLASKTISRIGRNRPQPSISISAGVCLLAAWILPILVMALRIFPHESAEECIVVIGTMLAFLIPLSWEMYKQNRLITAWNREAAKQAAELYHSPAVDRKKSQ